MTGSASALQQVHGIERSEEMPTDFLPRLLNGWTGGNCGLKFEVSTIGFADL